MATKFADINIPELATLLGISQSKVKEIGNTLLNENVNPTPELIGQVVQLYSSTNCDPILAAQEVAKSNGGSADQPIEEKSESADLINLLVEQSYSAIAPLIPIVKDMVTAKIAVDIASSIVNGDTFRNPGQYTKSVFSVVKEIAKAHKTDVFNSKGILGIIQGQKPFLAIAPSVEQLD